MIIENDFAPIAALELDPIKVKLMHEESGEGWSLAYADAVEFEYRRFLYLAKKFPHEQAAPLFDVDIFWHYHILDTMKYAADCDAVFGYFLHHFPYVGLRGAKDLEVHQRVGERMRELYEQTYGEAYLRQWPAAAAAVAASVGRQPAFSMPSSKSMTSMPAARAAFSMPTQQAAFSMPTQQAAFSMPTQQAAFSMPTQQAAFSMPTAPAALSMPAANAAFSMPAIKDIDLVGSGAVAAAMFNSARPTLPRNA